MPHHFEFDWDDGNEGHIAENGFDPADIEDAFRDPRAVPAPARSDPDEPRFGRIGRAPDGDILVIIYTPRRGMVRVITARRAERDEARRYRRRGK